MSNWEAGTLLRQARECAGLTQRAIAARAGTAQSVVARIEGGQSSPSWETLTRLIGAAGQQLRATLEPAPVLATHMLDDVTRILSLTAEQRLLEVANLSAFVAAARRV